MKLGGRLLASVLGWGDQAITSPGGDWSLVSAAVKPGVKAARLQGCKAARRRSGLGGCRAM